MVRQTISNLSNHVNQLTWRTFGKHDPADAPSTLTQPSTSRVLVGSSIIRDICQDNLTDTQVICKPGGQIRDIKAEVDSLESGYDEIALVVGGNDCDTDPSKPASHIADCYSTLIESAKLRAGKVTVCGACPRLTSTDVQEKIEAVNAGLSALCQDYDISYVDTNPAFRLQNGSVNDGYLLQDGVHLTRAATNKLASCLQLQVKDSECAWESVSRKKTRNKRRQEQPQPRESPHNLVEGTSIHDGGSQFKAFGAEVTCIKDVNEVLGHIKNTVSGKVATHCIMAYHLAHGEPAESCVDDGVHGAGGKLLRLLQQQDTRDTVVVVCRWYGARHLGAMRFQHIVDAGKDVLTAMGETTSTVSVSRRNRFETLNRHDDQMLSTPWSSQTWSSKQSNSSANSDVYCEFCGEMGHIKDRCRHGKSIDCFQCKRMGHKQKNCYLYYRDSAMKV